MSKIECSAMSTNPAIYHMGCVRIDFEGLSAFSRVLVAMIKIRSSLESTRKNVIKMKNDRDEFSGRFSPSHSARCILESSATNGMFVNRQQKSIDMSKYEPER